MRFCGLISCGLFLPITEYRIPNTEYRILFTLSPEPSRFAGLHFAARSLYPHAPAYTSNASPAKYAKNINAIKIFTCLLAPLNSFHINTPHNAATSVAP